MLEYVLLPFVFPGISFQSTDGEKTVISAHISNVPAEHLSNFGNTFKAALAHEAQNVDMERMRTIIEHDALEIADQFETDAHGVLSFAMISNFLYGSGKHLVASLSTDLQRYKTLASWSKEEWSAVLEKFVFPNLHAIELWLMRCVCLFPC